MYVIFGAGGFLGSYLVREISQATNEKILGLVHSEASVASDTCADWEVCDVSSRDDVDRISHGLLNDGDGLKIFYLAACHNPDEVKKNPRKAWDVNVTSLSYVVNALQNVKNFFYASTEMVYGEGDIHTFFRESDPLRPLNEYGKQKLVAEKIVCGYGYNVVRLPFMIGGSVSPSKKHFYDEIVGTLKSGNEMYMFADSYKSALDFRTVAEILVRLSMYGEEKVPATLNVCGDEVLSKFQIGRRIAESNGLDALLIKPITQKESGRFFTERRASCTLMDNTMLKKTLCVDAIKINLSYRRY